MAKPFSFQIFNLKLNFNLSFIQLPSFSLNHITLWCLINGGGPNSRVGGKFFENLINWGGKLGDPYLKIRYKIMFLMPIPRLIHSFSTSL